MATRQCSYFYQYEKDPSQFVYVDEVDRKYLTFRVFVGTLDNMVELPVDNVVRYRDGGTTEILVTGSEDVFCFPAKCRTDIGPTHGKLVLVERNKDDLPIMLFHPKLDPTPKQVLQQEIRKQKQVVEYSKSDLKKVADQVSYYQHEVVKYQRMLEQDTAAHQKKVAKLAEMESQLNEL
jgi:hypothetical protein